MPIFRNTKTIDVPIVVTTPAYEANDVVGGLLTISVHSAGGGGIIRRLAITDAANQKEAYALHFFDQSPTVIADAAAYAPTIADLKKLIGSVAIAALDYVELNSMAVVIKAAVGIEFESSDGNIYAYLVAVATPDYAAVTDLNMRMTVDLD